MERKDIIIIALIALIIYLYYQQAQQKALPIPPNNQELSELRNQANHYQTLYQKRVEADITGNQEKQIQSLTENLTQSQQENNLYQQKISYLENQVLGIAKQKVKGEKEFQQLIKQLEDMGSYALQEKEKKWQQKERAWAESNQLVFQNHKQDEQNWKLEKDEKQKTIEKLKKTSDNQAEQIGQLTEDLNFKAQQLQEANELVSIDKRQVIQKNKEYQEKIQEVLEIINKPLVYFWGKKEILEFLSPKELED